MRAESPEPARICESEVERLLGERAFAELAERLGYSLAERVIPADAYDAWGISRDAVQEIERLEVLAAGQGYRLLFVEGVEAYASIRRSMLAMQRRNRAECLVWWLVDADAITVAVVDRGPEGRELVRRMETRLDDPDAVGLRQWAELDVAELVGEDVADPAEKMGRHVRDVLRQEAMTREFFRGFREAHDALIEGMRNGPEEEQARHDIALVTLLRLIFLYFLQERGALDGDRRYIVRHYRAALDQELEFYGDVLRPLYFEVLNCAAPEREGRARELGVIPFLNGGLFEPLPAEREYPDLGWENGVWEEIVEGLFERYHFAVDEGVGRDEHRAVDPEMLGKVFEGVMYGDRRRESGSFYTPRDVVRTLVSEVIVAYFSAETSVSGGKVRAIVEGRSPELEPSERSELREELGCFRLLDPAVGTGAFLLEALRILERVYRVAGFDSDRGAYERRRAIVHRHLFGVDLQVTAVRLCALRLWLALLTAMPESWSADAIPPLPNLSHRVACGDSLLGPLDRARIDGVASSAFGGEFSSIDRLDEQHRRRLSEAQDAYLEAHGARKAALRRTMEELERGLERRLLEARIERLESKLEPFERLAASEDLFGEQVELDGAQEQRRDAIEEECGALRELLDDLESGRSRAGGFHYAARFGVALEGAGFDVVVTNPPWVRANRLDRDKRDLLERRYRSYSNELWRGASELGIRVPFGVQVDVASVFVERCIDLLRPGGHLGALLPAKVFRSLHGSGLRGVLAAHEVRSICDYSEADREMFEATVYPATLRVQKSEGAESKGARRPRSSEPRMRETPLELSSWRGGECRSWKKRLSRLPARGSDPRAPWLLVPPEISEVFDQLRRTSHALGAIEGLEPKRGVMTGRNGVFIAENADDAQSTFGAAAEEWTRPVLSGRDVAAWSIETDRRIVWPYDDQLQLRRDVPDALVEYFEAHREALEGRADYNPNRPIWQLFRLNSGLEGPKVVWRDLSPRLEAAPASSEAIPLNTVYYIPVETESRAERLAALFNSEPIRAYASALAERARGGWRRHFAWVVRMLPVPETVASRLGTSGEGDEPGAELGSGPIEEAFGIGSDEVEMLRAWRSSVGDRQIRGAA